MDRNEKILRLALSGSSYANLARKYNLTPPRIRQIVIRTVYKLSKDINIPNTGKTLACFDDTPAYSLKTLRDRKNRILTILNQNKIAKHI